VPLSVEAVHAGQEVDDAVASTLIKIKGAIDADDPSRLVQIGTSADLGVLAVAGPLVGAARGLIRMAKGQEGLMVLDHAVAHFPDSLGAKQLKGLALRRLGRYRDAIDVLSELRAAGHQDPETLGILAASWYGRYKETGKVIDLRKSREIYRTAF